MITHQALNELIGTESIEIEPITSIYPIQLSPSDRSPVKRSSHHLVMPTLFIKTKEGMKDQELAKEWEKAILIIIHGVILGDISIPGELFPTRKAPYDHP